MPAWIKIVNEGEGGEALEEVLQMAKTPHGTIDNVMKVHSLRPQTMRGHLVLYRAVLHDPANTFPGWFSEVVSSYVSILNSCEYSVANHWANAKQLIADDARASAILIALEAKTPETAFDGRELALLEYAEKLTLKPGEMTKADMAPLRSAGLDDGEILEANQIIAYFNYANRCLNGLGVTTKGDVVGYYPEHEE